MIKKLVLGVLLAGILGGFVLGKSAWSYLTTGYERATQTVEESVPLEFQIDRARKMVRDLEPEIRRSMHVIAKEEVEVESLDKRLEAAMGKAEKEKSEIMRLQSDLQSGKNVFRYAGLNYSADEVKQDLSRRFVRYKTSDATLGSLADMRKARQANLEAARDKLATMMNAQRQLQVEVENLEAQLKLVEVAQASSDLKLDDSQLARAKELITDIRTRLDVAAKLANPDRPVVAFTGDGSFMMTCAELATAAHHDLPIVFVVFNNSMYGTIRMYQERTYPYRYPGTALTNPDFVAFGRSFGADAVLVERTEDFVPAMQSAIASNRLSLIELRYDPEAITTRATLSGIRASALAAGR